MALFKRLLEYGAEVAEAAAGGWPYQPGALRPRGSPLAPAPNNAHRGAGTV